jgi:hypothetical protein
MQIKDLGFVFAVGARGFVFADRVRSAAALRRLKDIAAPRHFKNGSSRGFTFSDLVTLLAGASRL